MKPITYWVQNDAINQLVNQYGAHLEKLTAGYRREIIAFLAVQEERDWSDMLPHPLDVIYPIVETLNRHEKDLLMEAIAATLTHQGNPWVELGRSLVEQQKRHPLVPEMPTDIG